MKILLLSQFFSTSRGGGEYVFELLARTLAGNGHQVWVVTNRIQGEQYAERHGINLTFVKPTLKYQGGMPSGLLDNLRYAMNTVRAGKRLALEHGIDLIHSNNFAPALAGSRLSRITGLPHISTIHDVFSMCGTDYWSRWGRQAGVSRLGAMLAPLYERASVRFRMECIHTVSEASRNDIQKLGAKKPIHVIYNAIEQDEPVTGVMANPLQFVAVGRLVFYKNLETVIEAVGIARQSEPGIRLVIVGDGPYRQVLEELVQRLGLGANVIFAGHASSADKTRMIAESGAMLFPSTCEGFGLVILEAFCQKKPVLVSDVPPVSEIVEDGRTGHVIKSTDSSAWADKMIQCIREPKSTADMGNNGYCTLKSRYSQQAMYDKVIGMYQSVMS